MKLTKLTILLIALSASLSAQRTTVADHLADDFVKKHWKSGTLLFVSGACDGQAEALKYRYTEVKKAFPGIKNDWWNPAKSWPNKYKNGDPSQGEAYWGSTRWFVAPTDAYHTFREIGKASLVLSVSLSMSSFSAGFVPFIVDTLFYSFCYSAGFWATYEILYR